MGLPPGGVGMALPPCRATMALVGPGPGPCGADGYVFWSCCWSRHAEVVVYTQVHWGAERRRAAGFWIKS